MALKSGPTACLRHKFDLGEATVVVDWRQIQRATPQADGSSQTDKEKAKAKLPGADVPGKGAATFASLVQDLEARHVGKRGGADFGYARDGGFVISDDEETNDFEEDTEVSPDDFYVTQAPTERRKRAHAEVAGPEENQDDIVAKRRKLQEDMSGLVPEVREALSAFEKDWSSFTKGAILTRYPPELEAALLHVTNTAASHHPKKWVSSEVYELLQEVTGFTTHTLKAKIAKHRRSKDDPLSVGGSAGAATPTSIPVGANGSHAGPVLGDSASSGSTAVSGSVAASTTVPRGSVGILPNSTTQDAMAALRHAGREFEDVLNLPSDQRNQELHKLLELHIEQFSELIRDFVAGVKEPPKRSPWNDAMRQKIKLLFAINDSSVPPPVPASTLRAHLLSLWPESWEVKDTQIKPLTRYAPKPAKAHEA